MKGTILLSRRDVAALLNLDDCIASVEEALRLHAEGRTLRPGVLGVPATDGGFHIKAAGLRRERTWFAAKCNGNFFNNTSRRRWDTRTPSRSRPSRILRRRCARATSASPARPRRAS